MWIYKQKQRKLRRIRRRFFGGAETRKGFDITEISKHAYYIGLTPAQFYEMTMQEFIFLCEAKMKRFEDEQHAENMRTARICAVFANAFRDTKKKTEPFTEMDFMPVKKEEKKPKKPIDVNVMAEMFYALTESCGGVVER